MDGICKECLKSKKTGWYCVYCVLFGIMISGSHRGCKYFREKENTHEIREPKGEDGGRHI